MSIIGEQYYTDLGERRAELDRRNDFLSATPEDTELVPPEFLEYYLKGYNNGRG
jgi:hypothetical protein